MKQVDRRLWQYLSYSVTLFMDPLLKNLAVMQWGPEYSGGSNSEPVLNSDGPQLFGSSPNHSKTERWLVKVVLYKKHYFYFYI